VDTDGKKGFSAKTAQEVEGCRKGGLTFKKKGVPKGEGVKVPSGEERGSSLDGSGWREESGYCARKIRESHGITVGRSLGAPASEFFEKRGLGKKNPVQRNN